MLGLCLIFSMIVFLLVKLGLFNYVNWSVDKLNLSEKSPIMIRNYGADDFDWYYVLGILVNALNESSAYQRLTLIYLEPTQLSYFLIPLISIIYEDQFIKNKNFYISLFFISIFLALAFSAYASLFVGLTVLFINKYLNMIIKDTFTKKLFLYIYLLTSIILIISAPYFFPELTGSLIGLFSTEKKEQYISIFQFKEVFEDIMNLSLFGQDNSDLVEVPNSFGVIFAIYRYGSIGILLMVINAFYMIRFSINILFDQYVPLITRNILSLSIISCYLLSLKLTNILFIQPLILIIFALCIKEKYKEKFQFKCSIKEIY